MYAMIFGENEASDAILATLGLTRGDVGRFRDVFITDGKIAVYTRNGGGNRECWEDSKEGTECHCPGCTICDILPRHPMYLSDADDDFDSTYATVYFRFPPEYAEELRRLDSGEKFDPSQRWLDAIEALKRSMVPTAPPAQTPPAPDAPPAGGGE